MKKAERDNEILKTPATMAFGQFPAVENISD
jgi:hypothetical protein